MKTIAIAIGGVILFTLLVVGLDQFGYALGLWDTTSWGVKQANAERQVFTQNQSYVQGKQEYLSTLRMQYKTAPDDNHRAALKEQILQEASGVDQSKLSYDLQTFINQLQEQP